LKFQHDHPNEAGAAMNSLSPLLSFFDKIYIINLPERCDRRQKIQQELSLLGIAESHQQVAFFPAIKPTHAGDFPSIGARGCFLSHLEVLRQAKAENLNNVLIMEDDLAFSRRLIQQQGAIVGQLKNLNWDFVYFGHRENLASSPSGMFQEYSEALMLAHFLGVNQTAIAPLIYFLETILTRPSGHPEGGPMHVDGAYSTFRQQHPELITLIANPSLGFQRSSPSNIVGYKWFETLPVLTQMVRATREVKNWHKRNFSFD
jgi:hypothetical protein